MKRLLICLAVLMLSVSPLATVSADDARAKKPNVLLICVDDLKPLLGCYGDKTIQSPQIDALAKRGVLFERAYCNQAVCAPSRNSLLTGVRPSTLGIYDLGTNFRRAAPDAITLPQQFKLQGYRTEAVGKIFHVGHGNQEDVVSWSVPHWQAKSIAYVLPESKAKAGLTREEALFSNQSANNLPRGAAYEMADVDDDAYPDGKIAAEAIGRLRAAKERPETPFFLAVGFVKPHLPFCAPKKYWDLYPTLRDRPLLAADAKRRGPPSGAPSYAPQNSGELRQYAGVPDQGDIPDELARTLVHGYCAAISYMDAQLGKVIAELDRLELADNTIIVLWGDHGYHLGDHGIWCKHTNYEQATRIPLIIVAPQTIRDRGPSFRFVESIDIYPTLCDLAGIPQPAGSLKLEGESLAPALRDRTAKRKTHVIHMYPRGERLGRAVRTDRYRLVEWKKPGAPSDTAEYELYDYDADSNELVNVAKNQPEVVRELSAILVDLGEAKPQLGSGQDRNALFQRKDKNQDGKLTREEFLADQPDPKQAPARFERFDKDQNGELSQDEFVNQGK